MSELDLQRFTVQLLRLCARADCVWFHVPNGEYRSPRTAAKLKSMGVRAGVPDLALVLPDGGRTAFLELKTPKGRPSKEQKEFFRQATQAGALIGIAHTPEEVRRILTDWCVLDGHKIKIAEAAE